MLYSNDLKRLGLVSKTALSFIGEIHAKKLSDGFYSFENGGFAVVESISQREIAAKEDRLIIRVLLDGEERIEIGTLGEARVDNTSLQNCAAQSNICLRPESFLVLEPQDCCNQVTVLARGSAARVAVFEFLAPSVSVSDISLLVMDVDGTLTDGSLYLGANGSFDKAFNVKDGFGIKVILPSLQIVPVILTGRVSDALNARCKELSICHVYDGVQEKCDALNRIVEDFDCSLSDVAYVGDDLNDFPCMEMIKAHGGIVASPRDACPEVRAISDYVSENRGGRGAVRDFIEWLRNCRSGL